MNRTTIQQEKEFLEAIALYYDQINDPLVVAKGEGNIAAQMIQLAKQHQIHLHEDPHLMQQLSTLEIGDRIPQNLYQIIAEIIAYVYLLEGKTPKDFDPKNY